MLHKCANPACTAIFRYMREGKMFYVETELFSTPDTGRPHGERRKRSRRLEHYWFVMSAVYTSLSPLISIKEFLQYLCRTA